MFVPNGGEGARGRARVDIQPLPVPSIRVLVTSLLNQSEVFESDSASSWAVYVRRRNFWPRSTIYRLRWLSSLSSFPSVTGEEQKHAWGVSMPKHLTFHTRPPI